MTILSVSGYHHFIQQVYMVFLNASGIPLCGTMACDLVFGIELTESVIPKLRAYVNVMYELSWDLKQ